MLFAVTFQRGKQSLGFQWPPRPTLGSFSSSDLSTSSKDTSFMFTSNRPPAPDRERGKKKKKKTKQGRKVEEGGVGVQDAEKDERSEGGNKSGIT